jgi:hypothetical protein
MCISNENDNGNNGNNGNNDANASEQLPNNNEEGSSTTDAAAAAAAKTTLTSTTTTSDETTISEKRRSDDDVDDDTPSSTSTSTSTTTTTTNIYCLQKSHLLLAWKTCIRKTDAAVSAQIYQLLVSVLFSNHCPVSLAVSLLQAVQESLNNNNNTQGQVQGQPTDSIITNGGINNNTNNNNNNNMIKHDDCLTEVSDFCEALAVSSYNNNNNNNSNSNNKGGGGGGGSASSSSTNTELLCNDVRTEVLKLLWSVLIHPDASSLKSYDIIKQYVTRELRVEPDGKEHRETYLKACVLSLMENSKRHHQSTQSSSATILAAGTGVAVAVAVDFEIRALKMVKLTHFVLEACPRTQAADLVTNDKGELPVLLFEELTAFLKRKPQTPLRKVRILLLLILLLLLIQQRRKEINVTPEDFILVFCHVIPSQILYSYQYVVFIVLFFSFVFLLLLLLIKKLSHLQSIRMEHLERSRFRNG